MTSRGAWKLGGLEHAGDDDEVDDDEVNDDEDDGGGEDYDGHRVYEHAGDDDDQDHGDDKGNDDVFRDVSKTFSKVNNMMDLQQIIVFVLQYTEGPL